MPENDHNPIDNPAEPGGTSQGDTSQGDTGQGGTGQGGTGQGGAMAAEGIPHGAGHPHPPAHADSPPKTETGASPAPGGSPLSQERASGTPAPHADGNTPTADSAPTKRRGFHPGLVLATVAVVLAIIYTFPVLLMRVRAAPNEAQALAALRTFARRTTLGEGEENALASFLDRHGDAGLPFAGYRFYLHNMTDFRYLTQSPQVPQGSERTILLIASPVVPGVSGRRGFVYSEVGGEAGRLYARPVGRDVEGGTKMLEFLATAHRARSDGAEEWVLLPLDE